MSAEHRDGADPVQGPRLWSVEPHAAWTRSTDGSAAVMDMRVGVPLTLSVTGTLVWEVLLGGRGPEDDLADVRPRSQEEIVVTVAEVCQVPREVVHDDVVGFLGSLARHGILHHR